MEEASVYLLISGTSGDVSARFDYSATAGDVAITLLIVAITLSLWAMWFLARITLMKETS